MIKKDVVYRLCETTGLSKAEEAVDAIIAEIKNALAFGECVSMVRFGGLRVANKSSRPGRNPKTGETITISARKVVIFKASEKLKEAVNSAPVKEK